MTPDLSENRSHLREDRPKPGRARRPLDPLSDAPVTLPCGEHGGGCGTSTQSGEEQTKGRPGAAGSTTGSVDDLPIALTVPEAAAVLRVGRNKVYDLVHQWHATSGEQGLRSVSLGRSVRIPRVAVLDFLGIVLAISEGQAPSADLAGVRAKTRPLSSPGHLRAVSR